MTRRLVWAAKKLEKYVLDADLGIAVVSEATAQNELLKEHARALWVVRRLTRRARIDVHTRDSRQREAYLSALADVLAALQRGRT